MTSTLPQVSSLAPSSLATLTGTPLAMPQMTVSIPASMRVGLDAQLNSYVQAFMGENVSSPEFQARLDRTFALGREEIASAATLTNTFTSQNFAGDTESPAYLAIAELRTMFEELNPANQGNLFTAHRVLGVPIPFVSKLQRYLRKYQSGQAHMAAIHENVLAAKSVLEQNVSSLRGLQDQVWANLESLEGVVYFINSLDSRLSERIEALRSTDPLRAAVMESEVLYYIRQNVSDVLAMQAVTMNCYQFLGGLRKTGREAVNGCDRVATLGLAALNMGVIMARQVGIQVKTMATLNQAKSTVENLVLANGKAMVEHAQVTADFANNPLMGVQVLQQMFDQTNTAMTILEDSRKQSLALNATNNALITEQVSAQMAKVREVRSSARQALLAPTGAADVPRSIAL